MIASGVIRDQSGDPISDAFVHDGWNAVTADESGRFSLQTDGDTVTIEAVGYLGVSLPVSSGMNVILEPDPDDQPPTVVIVGKKVIRRNTLKTVLFVLVVMALVWWYWRRK